MGLALVLIFRFTAVEKAPFAASFAVVFLVFQAVEIAWVLRRREGEGSRQGGLGKP